jgi:hypothetical protein
MFSKIEIQIQFKEKNLQTRAENLPKPWFENLSPHIGSQKTFLLFLKGDEFSFLLQTI